MFFNYDEYNQNDWQDQTGVTKHGSPDARFKKYFMKDKSIQQRKYYKETEVKCTIKSILVTN